MLKINMFNPLKIVMETKLKKKLKWNLQHGYSKQMHQISHTHTHSVPQLLHLPLLVATDIY